jgi:hypothetical protein
VRVLPLVVVEVTVEEVAGASATEDEAEGVVDQEADLGIEAEVAVAIAVEALRAVSLCPTCI